MREPKGIYDREAISLLFADDLGQNSKVLAAASLLERAKQPGSQSQALSLQDAVLFAEAVAIVERTAGTADTDIKAWANKLNRLDTTEQLIQPGIDFLTRWRELFLNAADELLLQSKQKKEKSSSR